MSLWRALAHPVCVRVSVSLWHARPQAHAFATEAQLRTAQSGLAAAQSAAAAAEARAAQAEAAAAAAAAAAASAATASAAQANGEPALPSRVPGRAQPRSRLQPLVWPSYRGAPTPCTLAAARPHTRRVQRFQARARTSTARNCAPRLDTTHTESAAASCLYARSHGRCDSQRGGRPG